MKTTLKQRIVQFVAANGPVTRKEILAAVGVKPTSLSSYFATVTDRSSPYYGEADYARKTKGSMVAMKQLIPTGKTKEGAILYAVGPTAGKLLAGQ